VGGAGAKLDIVEVAVLQVELTLRCASYGLIICPGQHRSYGR
jgi:hypothetical protein